MCRLVITRIPNGSPNKQETAHGFNLKFAPTREAFVDSTLCLLNPHHSFGGIAFKPNLRKQICDKQMNSHQFLCRRLLRLHALIFSHGSRIPCSRQSSDR
jgi:hypothetical protein